MNTPSQQWKYGAFVLVCWLVSALIGGWFDIFTAPGELPIFLGVFLALPILFLPRYTS